jgi:transposase
MGVPDIIYLYIWGMFVRKKKNPSGKISVQVIDKSSGKYKVVKTIGSSIDRLEVEKLYQKGEEWIKTHLGILEFPFDAKSQAEKFFDSIEAITVSGTTLLLEKIYHSIGFDKIGNEILKLLVFSRLVFPRSKLKTTELLEEYYNEEVNVYKIYRQLDKIYAKEKSLIEEISYRHTLEVLGGKISIVFYDVTTLYFEIDEEDTIRKRGFSKEGKHQNPQIVLGLLVSIDGYPLAYEIFEGNKFEGHTMFPVVDRFKKKYGIRKLVIIADSGLLSKENIELLRTKGYEFILGARIKNEKEEMKEKILSLQLNDGESKIIKKEGLSLVINYSAKRAKKDEFNRNRGLKRLEKQIKAGRLTKANINNRGYNKYLKMEGDVKISIDIEKFQNDAKWDGLKGYITNTNLSEKEIIDNYNHLWKIEKAFRISKHDLKIRPIYHRLETRIKTHIIISFVAYKVYKELERQLKLRNSKLTPEKAIEIAKSIYSVKVRLPNSEQSVTKNLFLTEQQRYLAKIFNL